MQLKELSEKNSQLHDQLYRGGEVIINKFKLQDYREILPYGENGTITALGTIIGSDTLNYDDLALVLSVLERTADAVLKAKAPTRTTVSSTILQQVSIQNKQNR